MVNWVKLRSYTILVKRLLQSYENISKPGAVDQALNSVDAFGKEDVARSGLEADSETLKDV